ncbi:hypothetical protein MMC25_002174 [Agyrium rufum]|nr:hypothetical protein [Agyrium rufum]
MPWNDDRVAMDPDGGTLRGLVQSMRDGKSVNREHFRRPYVFINVPNSITECPFELSSKCSPHFQEVVIGLAIGLLTAGVCRAKQLTIISLYRTELSQLIATFKRLQLDREYQHLNLHDLRVSTAETYTSQETSVIIVDTVASSNGGGRVDFADNLGRLNLALSRAQSALFIVADPIVYWNMRSVRKRIVKPDQKEVKTGDDEEIKVFEIGSYVQDIANWCSDRGAVVVEEPTKETSKFADVERFGKFFLDEEDPNTISNDW